MMVSLAPLRRAERAAAAYSGGRTVLGLSLLGAEGPKMWGVVHLGWGAVVCVLLHGAYAMQTVYIASVHVWCVCSVRMHMPATGARCGRGRIWWCVTPLAGGDGEIHAQGVALQPVAHPRAPLTTLEAMHV